MYVPFLSCPFDIFSQLTTVTLDIISDQRCKNDESERIRAIRIAKTRLGTISSLPLCRLREMEIDPKYSRQRINIKLAVRMYESGELPKGHGVSTWFVDGNVLKSWPTSVEKGVALWNEVSLRTILSFHVAYFIFRAYEPS